LEDNDGVIKTTKSRGRPKRRHSEGVGNHSSKRPRTASVEVTLPADTATNYNIPSTSSSIMSEVVNVILAQVASQQQQQSQVISTDLQSNVEVVAAPPPSNELIIIENSLDSTNTVEVWAGGEGGGANMTGEVNEILERIGVGEETIQDPVEGNVMVTETTAEEEVVSQEIITEETPCEECAAVVIDSVIKQTELTSVEASDGDAVIRDDANDSVPVASENVVVDKTKTTDNVTTPHTDDVILPNTDGVILPNNDDITTTSNDNTVQ